MKSNAFMPVSPASCIFFINFPAAEPPASALIPTEVNPAARAKIASFDIPANSPVDAMRWAMVISSPSVVARLLPNAVTADATRVMFSKLP